MYAEKSTSTEAKMRDTKARTESKAFGFSSDGLIPCGRYQGSYTAQLLLVVQASSS